MRRMRFTDLSNENYDMVELPFDETTLLIKGNDKTGICTVIARCNGYDYVLHRTGENKTDAYKYMTNISAWFAEHPDRSILSLGNVCEWEIRHACKHKEQHRTDLGNDI